jgi:hypothetical protein
VKRLLQLQREIRELNKKFAPPPSPPDCARALIADLWSAVTLIVLFHGHGWNNSSDGLEEIVRLLGIPEFVEWNWNTPGVEDAVCKLYFENIGTKLRALVEERGGQWMDDGTMGFFTDELKSLYSEIPAGLKHKYSLPREFVDFRSRAEALVEQK